MSRLETVLGSRNRVKVLRVLLKKDGICGREVARNADLSASAANVALTELVEAGVVFKNGTVGKNLFEMNRNHYLVAQIAKLFDDEAALGQKMFEVVKKYVNDFPRKTEFMGIGCDDEGATVVFRPVIDTADPQLRQMGRALKTEFGINTIRTDQDISALAGLSSVRLAVTDKTAERAKASARERTLNFFGIRQANVSEKGHR